MTKGDVFPQLFEELLEGEFRKIIDEKSTPLLVAMITGIIVVFYHVLSTLISLGEVLFIAWFFYALRAKGYQSLEELEHSQ